MKPFLYPVLLTVVSLLSAPALAGLIVVEDRGGDSALSYYKVLDSPKARGAPPASRKPLIRSLSEAEAALLPVRSARLLPGIEPARAIHAPGFAPVFLIGDDARSRAWLARRHAELHDMSAVGLVVNVATPTALAELRRLAPGLTLSPVSGDDFALRLGIRHYPVVITATGVRGLKTED
jgi:integrating conjugative element protein (TIGR03765 family)